MIASGDGNCITPPGRLFCASSYISWVGRADGNATSGTTPPDNGFWRHDESADIATRELGEDTSGRKGAAGVDLEQKMRGWWQNTCAHAYMHTRKP